MSTACTSYCPLTAAGPPTRPSPSAGRLSVPGPDWLRRRPETRGATPEARRKRLNRNRKGSRLSDKRGTFSCYLYPAEENTAEKPLIMLQRHASVPVFSLCCLICIYREKSVRQGIMVMSNVGTMKLIRKRGMHGLTSRTGPSGEVLRPCS